MHAAPAPSIELPGDLRLRRAVASDADQIVALNREHNGAGAGDTTRALLTEGGPGPDIFTVVADGDKVASTLCLIPETFRMGDVTLPVGRPEFVVTDPGYRDRGLIRAQMDEVHRWSREQGDLAQLIGGTEYFYRLFGYEYAISRVGGFIIPQRFATEMPDGFTVRAATQDDAGEVARLEALMQAEVPLSCVVPESRLRRLLARNEGRYVVAERDGICGAAIFEYDAERATTVVFRIAVEHADAARALLAHVRKPGELRVQGRHGTVARLFGPAGRYVADRDAYYVRVEDPAALLDRIRPVLTRRLADSLYAGLTTRLLTSMYARSLTLVIERGVVVGVESGPGVQHPVAEGGVGIPPDLIATLLFGRWPVAELQDREADVVLGPHQGVMHVLFPQMQADVQLVS